MAYEPTLEDIFEAEAMQEQQQPKKTGGYQPTLEDILEAEAMQQQQPEQEQPTLNLWQQAQQRLAQRAYESPLPQDIAYQKARSAIPAFTESMREKISALPGLTPYTAEYEQFAPIPEQEKSIYQKAAESGQQLGKTVGPIIPQLSADIITGLITKNPLAVIGASGLTEAAFTEGGVPERVVGFARGAALPAAVTGTAKLGATVAKAFPRQFKQLQESTKKAVDFTKGSLNKLENYLQPKRAHEEYASQAIQEKAKSIEKAITEKYYKPFDKALEGKTVSNTQAANISNEMNNLANQISPDVLSLNPELARIVQDVPFTISASKLNDELKVIKSEINKAYNEIKKRGKFRNELDAQFAYNSLGKLQESRNAIEKQLAEAVGGEAMKLQKTGSKAWKELVVPTYYDPTWKNIKEGVNVQDLLTKSSQRTPGGTLLGDIVKGNLASKYKGTDIGKDLEEVFKHDKQLLKDVIAERHKTNFDKLIDADEKTLRFVDKLPELKDLLTTHRTNLSKQQQLEQALSEMTGTKKQARKVLKQVPTVGAKYGLGAAGIGGAFSLINQLTSNK